MQHNIVLIGSGNLATALGLKLKSTGHRILQVYSREISHSKLLADKLECDAINSLQTINKDASIYLICIKDDAIADVSTILAGIISTDKTIAHSSGVNSPDIIDNAFINRGLFYPLQSFSRFKDPEWSQIPVFIEGNQETSKILKDLAESICNEVYVMDEKIRTHLHLASVFANNFSNYNLVIAKKILDQSNVPFKVLKSLMKETVDKAFLIEPHDAQTGPAKRGDLQSIEKHIRLLVQEFPEYRSLYKKYSQIIQQDYKHENPGSNSSS
jgi:predicted short-subunit dehydrogenase-like oxidoreductase (DUF2520 family)